MSQPIIFYFIKNNNHPMLKIIYDKLHNTKGFLNLLKNLCNMITKEINNIKRTPIWNKYYNISKTQLTVLMMHKNVAILTDCYLLALGHVLCRLAQDDRPKSVSTHCIKEDVSV